jgi:(p)ppGpp synthase/HD superfamily hydrolase
MTNIVAAARDFANWAHTYQTKDGEPQKYDDKPYSYHTDRVAQILVDFGYTNENLLAAAHLHDVLEDTYIGTRPSTEYNVIRRLFPVEVYYFVIGVTGIGSNRKQRKSYVLNMWDKETQYTEPNFLQPWIVLKAADRLANMRYSAKNNPRMFIMYRNELEDYRPWFEKYAKNILDEIDKLVSEIKI